MATITGLNASTIMRNIEKMRSTYLRRVGSNKFWEIIKYYNTITSPTKYLVWLGLFCIGLFQFLLHQTIRDLCKTYYLSILTYTLLEE